jgi:hypothetical protein
MSSVLKKSLALLFGSFTSLFAYYTLKIYLKRRKYRHIPGPSTNGISGFYKGNVNEIIEFTKRGETLWDMLLE